MVGTKRLRGLNFDIVTLWHALRDPRTPVLPKVIVALMVLYIVSPVDFLPDLLPILGIVDDALVIPAGTSLALSALPDDVFARSKAISHRKRAQVLRFALIGGAVLLLAVLAIIYR